jgi:hypothetical protein
MATTMTTTTTTTTTTTQMSIESSKTKHQAIAIDKQQTSLHTKAMSVVVGARVFVCDATHSWQRGTIVSMRQVPLGTEFVVQRTDVPGGAAASMTTTVLHNASKNKLDECVRVHAASLSLSLPSLTAAQLIPLDADEDAHDDLTGTASLRSCVRGTDVFAFVRHTLQRSRR